MSTSTRITLHDYHEMIREGRFEPREEHHVELIYGEIIPMSPVGPPHCEYLNRVLDSLYRKVPKKRASVRVQQPIELPALESEPEPDLVLVRPGSYLGRHPLPDEVLLLIEVSDTSLARDRGLKADLYASAGIADYRIVNVLDQCIEVRRDPHDGNYRSIETFRSGQEARPLALPDAALTLERLFT